MARPIPLELPKRDPREELRSRLEQAPVEHAEAILAGFEVLQALHDRGVLELIRGIRNLLILSKTVGAIDPELLKRFAEAVPDALAGAAKAQEKEPPGSWEALRLVRSRNLRRSLAVMNSVLEALGKNFSPEKS